MAYIGNVPLPQATEARVEVTATASQTSFTGLSYVENFLDVYLNGVKLASSDFTATDGSSCTLASGAAADDIVAFVSRTQTSALMALPLKDSAGNNVLSESGGVITIENVDNATIGNNLLLNTSTFLGGSTVGMQINATNNISGAYAILIKNSDGNEIFQFKTDGSAASSSGGSFGTTSDRNLKENIVDATPKLLDVLNLQVRNFNNKSDSNKTKFIGFIAQEVETVFPNLVQGDLNGVKSIKTSLLIPILTKAIQEQQSQIDALTARIEALETT